MLGIYTAGFDDGHAAPLGERTRIFQSMTESGAHLGFDTVVFGYQHVLAGKAIRGFTYQDGEWVQQDFPLPTVIYDRIPNRKVEHHPSVKDMKEQLRDEAKWFNSGFFNKWRIYDKLKKNPKVNYFLPLTILHPSEEKLERLLHKHKSLYVKPINGSKGEGIKKLSINSSNRVYECEYYQGEKNIHQRYHQFSELYKQQYPSGLYGTIVQPEIELMTKRKTPMDFRVHTNKNERNQWEVTAICTKFAGKGSVTTHVKRGGSLHTLEEVFGKDQEEKIRKKLTKVALELAKAVEQIEGEQPLGEIGFDLGIDADGHVWLFEANSKPGFAILDHPYFIKEEEKFLSYPYRFSSYLIDEHSTLLYT
ncbi:hypothetical protein N781_14755 [Pontibacillus halophilus JSM 076056 = DSM 19796]|uniref:ATP-grasp domain-containing protein n=1 Tax=Pontibacillus halophilus JSM 076056 = DSM 19796 TaxID=1385510 RepID=A0A0A5GMY7_9BACI|nr:hypothetical protein N781_14755 [Pontibacillus halophilus JSM 076056 = DSM 19796]